MHHYNCNNITKTWIQIYVPPKLKCLFLKYFLAIRWWFNQDKKPSGINTKRKEIGFKFRTTDLSNFDNRWWDVYFVPFFFYSYCNYYIFIYFIIFLQNVVSRLFMREIHGPSARSKARNHRGKLVNTARGFYMNVYPNYTLVNVEKPPCFLRKFTPCGKYFIAFSMCQTSLEIYRYVKIFNFFYSVLTKVSGRSSNFLKDLKAKKSSKSSWIFFPVFSLLRFWILLRNV